MFSDLHFGRRVNMLAFGLAILITGLLAGDVIAQTNDDGFTPPPPAPPPSIHESLPGMLPIFVPPISEIYPVEEVPIDNALAASISKSINASKQFCSTLPSAYRVGCLGERLEAIAKSLPRGEGNDEVRKVLTDASRKLDRIAEKYRDTTKPRINASVGGPTPMATTRPLVAVRPEAEAAAMAEAAVVLEQAGDLLLRSSIQSQTHAAQYRTIAEALDSTALLLRS